MWLRRMKNQEGKVKKWHCDWGEVGKELLSHSCWPHVVGNFLRCTEKDNDSGATFLYKFRRKTLDDLLNEECRTQDFLISNRMWQRQWDVFSVIMWHRLEPIFLRRFALPCWLLGTKKLSWDDQARSWLPTLVNHSTTRNAGPNLKILQKYECW